MAIRTAYDAMTIALVPLSDRTDLSFAENVKSINRMTELINKLMPRANMTIITMRIVELFKTHGKTIMKLITQRIAPRIAKCRIILSQVHPRWAREATNKATPQPMSMKKPGAQKHVTKRVAQ